MKADHFEILVEEPSMEAFLRQVLPGSLAPRATFEIYVYQGKYDLLTRLEERLRGYAAWLPQNWRIVVVLDRDDDDCLALKRRLELIASKTGLATRTYAASCWRIIFRIAIEELEAWYFGEWEAVRATYTRVRGGMPRKTGYRDCDAIMGGTWESFEREMQKAGYFAGGLRKIEAAHAIGSRFVARRCASRSFRQLMAALEEALVSPPSAATDRSVQN